MGGVEERERGGGFMKKTKTEQSWLGKGGVKWVVEFFPPQDCIINCSDCTVPGFEDQDRTACTSCKLTFTPSSDSNRINLLVLLRRYFG